MFCSFSFSFSDDGKRRDELENGDGVVFTSDLCLLLLLMDHIKAAGNTYFMCMDGGHNSFQ